MNAAPCPGCGSDVVIAGVGIARLNDAGKRIGPFSQAQCGSIDKGCGYAGPYGNDIDDAIAKHNAICERRPAPEPMGQPVAWILTHAEHKMQLLWNDEIQPGPGRATRQRMEETGWGYIPLYEHPQAHPPVMADAEACAKEIFEFAVQRLKPDVRPDWRLKPEWIVAIIRKHFQHSPAPGMVLVPEEPTEAMKKAGATDLQPYTCIDEDDAHFIYKAMLKASRE